MSRYLFVGNCNSLTYWKIAKERQRQREQEASSSSSTSLNVNKKRPLGVTTSPTGPKAGPKPLKRDSRLGKYFDYDLSKMVNSKGGFLVEDGKEIDENLQRKEKERERQRAQQNIDPRKPRFIICR